MITWWILNHLMVHGWHDIAVGTDTRYCGLYITKHAVQLYCQSAR
jgi:hypothetical protein